MIKATDRKYHLWTIGCQMNAADSRALASKLEALGYSPTDEANSADLVVLNTCVIRQQAEDKIYGRLGSLRTLKEQNPESVVAVMGCLVGRHEAPLLKKRFPFVDVFMAPSETTPLIDFLEANELYDQALVVENESRALRDAIQDASKVLPADLRGGAVTAFVPIVLGCSHACTYCIIPYRRGIERSRPQAEILEEIRAFAGQGVREVMLLGQIVDRYGKDLENGESLASLMREVHEIDGVERIRFLTSHPNWMTDDLLRTVGELPKVCPQLEVPVQAASDEVLANMRRGYTRDDYRRLIDRIRNIVPDPAIHTDVIVGFCGETDEQFMDTYRLVEEVRFDKVHLAKYSERPRTVAQRRMTDDVPEAEKSRRWHAISDLQHDILEEKMGRLHRTTQQVLVEENQRGRWHGRTPHNKIVYFADPRPDLEGQLVDVLIDWAGPYSLVGRSTTCLDTVPAADEPVPQP